MTYVESERGPAKRPCPSCPYRTDVPSGVWHEEEYDKLPPYDIPETGEQPVVAFFCHQQNGRLCAGWVGCHDMEESLAMRLGFVSGLSPEDVAAARAYECPTSLWPSGAAAREHGMEGYGEPDEDVIEVHRRLIRKGNVGYGEQPGSLDQHHKYLTDGGEQPPA